MKPVSFLQTDKRWANTDYSAKGEKTTIGKSGCGPTCMAMVVSTFTDNKVTPADACAWALKKGYKAPNQGTYYSFFEPYGKTYGLEVRQINGTNIRGMSSVKSAPYHNKAIEAIKSGNLVIACMGEGHWTRSGHFILLYGFDGSKVLINDPNSVATDRIKAELSLLQKEVKYYFICTKPATVHQHSQNYYDVQNKYGFDDTTMQYLEAYQYADSLFAIMLMNKGQQKYQLVTIKYILDYKYGKDVFNRIIS